MLSGLFRERVFFVSYPKSGRTWLRAMLGSYLYFKYEGGVPSSFVDVRNMSDKYRLAKIKFTHDGASMKQGLDFHDLRNGHREYRRSKVVFVGRDVRDTLISAYFQAVKRIGVYDGDVSSFLRNKFYGVDKILSFYEIWHEAHKEPLSFLYTSYEMMHENTHRELRRVLDFMNIDVEEELVNKAVESCSFFNMKRMERSGSGVSSAFQPVNEHDPESYKARSGKVGGYIDHLSEDDVSYINKRSRDYGINLGNPWSVG